MDEKTKKETGDVERQVVCVRDTAGNVVVGTLLYVNYELGYVELFRPVLVQVTGNETTLSEYILGAREVKVFTSALPKVIDPAIEILAKMYYQYWEERSRRNQSTDKNPVMRVDESTNQPTQSEC